MSLVLDVKDLEKTYRHKGSLVEALKGISFSIEEGEIFAFLGPNGSGKTSTMNCIAGLIVPDKGMISVLGKDPTHRNYFDDISFLNGDGHFFWTMKGIDILTFYAEIKGVKRDRINELLDQFGMLGKETRRWQQYSNGEKTRIRLVRALLKQPKILFLDEPTVGLDPDAADQVRSFLMTLRSEGVTIMITSHDMQDIDPLADRICFLHQGEIQALGPLSQFRKPRQYIDIELEAGIPAGLPPDAEVHGSCLRIPYDALARHFGLESIRVVKAEEETLQEYFIALARENRGEKSAT